MQAQPMRPPGGPIQTPFVYDAADYLDRHLTITINFDNATRALQNAVIHRDADCMYIHIYVGVGADGKPDSSTHSFAVPNLEGDRNIGQAGLNGAGLTTIEDVIALGQIAAGP